MEPHEVWRNPVDGSVLRRIPAGDFTMGSTDVEIASALRMDAEGDEFPLHHETPQSKVWLPEYSISIYAVTNRQFVQFLNQAKPSVDERDFWIPSLARIVAPLCPEGEYYVVDGFGLHPAANVSWFGAKAYCSWAGLRLPTEIEWEKAARGSDGRIFPWGDSWDEGKLCWWGSHDETRTTSPVDVFPNGRSPYGIYQMAGNVEEWCEDWYQEKVYERYAVGNVALPRAGRGRVLRGANCMRKHRLEFRCAMRRGNSPSFTNILLTGIRCASSATSLGLPRNTNP